MIYGISYFEWTIIGFLAILLIMMIFIGEI